MMFYFLLLFHTPSGGATYSGQISVVGSATAAATGSIGSAGDRVGAGGGGRHGKLPRFRKVPANRRHDLGIDAILQGLEASANGQVFVGLETIFNSFSKNQRMKDWVFGKARSNMGAAAMAQATVKKRDLALHLMMDSLEIEDFR